MRGDLDIKPTSPPLPTSEAGRARASLSLMWRAFQLAFKVYQFAGGQDEASEELCLAVASEMEMYPQSAWA